MNHERSIHGKLLSKLFADEECCIHLLSSFIIVIVMLSAVAKISCALYHHKIKRVGTEFNRTPNVLNPCQLSDPRAEVQSIMSCFS